MTVATDNIQIFQKAIHPKVLVVYVATTPDGDWPGDWKAYVVPVQGENHNLEAGAWRTKGQQLSESEARAFWPSLTTTFDTWGLNWRR